MRMDTPITVSDRPARQTKELTIGCQVLPAIAPSKETEALRRFPASN
jgi:hypothetical protein